MAELRQLYAETEPIAEGWLEVGDGHALYWKRLGTEGGIPAVILHGGPGGGLTADEPRLFDPTLYDILTFDQRGCGRSTPFASLDHNTTWDLVEDIEKLRQMLGHERWIVLGGSWGSSLALVYAQTHRTHVTGLILRGIFTLRRQELDWYYQGGASRLFPDKWESFLVPIPPSERNDLIGAYRRRLTSPDRATQLAAARAWALWEGETGTLLPQPDVTDGFRGDDFALAFARIENHYFVHGGWFEEGQLLRDVSRLRGLPGVIIQGRYDVTCPMQTAWDLHVAWPEADLRIVADAGHSQTEPGLRHELIAATDRFATLLAKTAI